MSTPFLLVAALCLFDCAAPERIITLKRTACFGPCPVYTLDIYSNRQVNLVAEKFVAVGEGDFHLKLSKEDFEEIKRQFNASGFFSFEDRYEARLSDLPTIFLTFSDGKATKTIELYGNGPEVLHALADSLQQLVEQQDWRRGRLK